jgi:O-acetyl-ADP-ribose deacetylase (regulator of RNase III)
MLTIIEGNILSAKEQYIAHQCNCVTHTAAGLAAIIFTKWSYADCYSIRWKNDVPGNIEIRGNGKENRFIINMFGQFNPGKPPSPEDEKDGIQARKKYFIECMKKIEALKPDSIAIPWQIGCGLAGGDWDFYKKVIDKFAERINITLYQLPSKK